MRTHTQPRKMSHSPDEPPSLSSLPSSPLSLATPLCSSKAAAPGASECAQRGQRGCARGCAAATTGTAPPPPLGIYDSFDTTPVPNWIDILRLSARHGNAGVPTIISAPGYLDAPKRTGPRHRQGGTRLHRGTGRSLPLPAIQPPVGTTGSAPSAGPASQSKPTQPPRPVYPAAFGFCL